MFNYKTLNLIVLTGESFFLTYVLMLLLIPFAFKIGLVDHPCSRKNHSNKTPLIGGLAIYLGFCFTIISQNINISTALPFLIATSIIVITGLIDDFTNLNFKTRLTTEIIAALIMVNWGGIEITSLGDLLGFGEIKLGIFSTLFTIFAIVGGINAFNMIDGIDGLAGCTSLIIYALLSVLALLNNSPDFLIYTFIFAPASLAFLIFNFPASSRKNASAFLGDTGSMLFGFTICCLVIAASQGEQKIISPVTVLWLIAAPVLDSLGIMIRRACKGRSPFAPDREHFHHILPVAGYSKQATLMLILLFATLTAIFGIVSQVLFHVPDWLMFILFIALFLFYYWSLTHAWRMVKVARYLREHKSDRRSIPDRRKVHIDMPLVSERRVSANRRVILDRRYQATQNDLAFFYAQDRRANVIKNVYKLSQTKND